jgi:hypothetical protein
MHINHPKDKLKQIIAEMQDSKYYYAQPQREQQVSVVMPDKQTEWISRLMMIEESLCDED